MKEEVPVLGHKENKLGTKGQLRKAKVMSVAGSILINEGVDNLILRKVATVADIKLGHLQYYFPTRDDLLEALIYEKRAFQQGANSRDGDQNGSNDRVRD